MSLSVVYGREVGGRTTTFGTSGYTYDNTFVLYDRATESLWYPLDDRGLTAVSGPEKGQRIAFSAKPARMKLGAWRRLHPRTDVLLGDRSQVRDASSAGGGSTPD